MAQGCKLQQQLHAQFDHLIQLFMLHMEPLNLQTLDVIIMDKLYCVFKRILLVVGAALRNSAQNCMSKTHMWLPQVNFTALSVLNLIPLKENKYSITQK